MLTESGVIVAVEADGLWVQTRKQSTCHACRARHGCGEKLFVQTQTNALPIKAVFTNGDHARQIWKAGDAVTIGVQEQAFLAASVVVYLLPLACMFAFMAAANTFSANQPLVATAALLGLLVGGGLVRVCCERLICKQPSGFQARVVSTISQPHPKVVASQ